MRDQLETGNAADASHAFRDDFRPNPMGRPARSGELSSQALGLLQRLKADRHALLFDVEAGWELVERDLAALQDNPFRIEITLEGRKHDARPGGWLEAATRVQGASPGSDGPEAG